MARRFAALLAAPLFAASCSIPFEEERHGPNASGVYTRAAWHLMVSCEGQELAHKATIVYPANTEASTYVIEDHSGDLEVRFGDVVIGTGSRDGKDITIDLTQLDDSPEPVVDWRLRARIEESLPFHAKALVGHLEPAVAPTEGPGCSFGEKNLVWWAEEPDPEGLRRSGIVGDEPGPLLGMYDLFAWWIRLGSVSPDPQKGVDRATIAGDLVSLAVSPDPSIEVDAEGAVFVRNGVTTPGVGVADPTGLWFQQADHQLVDVSVSQAVLLDENRSEGQAIGVQRVVVGFVDGSVHIDPDFYPTGVTGPAGWLKIERPGLAFWEDVDYGPAGEPGAASFAPAASPTRVIEATPGRQRFVDGVLR